jgi:hypothetical protein
LECKLRFEDIGMSVEDGMSVEELVAQLVSQELEHIASLDPNHQNRLVNSKKVLDRYLLNRGSTITVKGGLRYLEFEGTTYDVTDAVTDFVSNLVGG